MNIWIRRISWIWVGVLSIIGFLEASVHNAPDYGLVTTDNTARYLYVIAFVDKNTANVYHNDPSTIRRAVAKTFITANTYFYQLDVRLILADVIITDQNFGQLPETNKFHNELRAKRELPYHDFAVFLASGRLYGSAWPGQICRPYSGIIVPMNPYTPEESGPIIFEQFSTLVNLSKTENPEEVKGCRCKVHNSTSGTSGKGSNINEKCLQIPGFPHNCAFQGLFNKLKETKCILKKIRLHYDDVTGGFIEKEPSAQIRLKKVSICGNAIVEAGEDCDCGYKRSCRDSLQKKVCDQSRCQWEGSTSREDEVRQQEICECTFERKVFKRHCGNRKCTLGIPDWVVDGVMYSITGIFITLFCCFFSCIYGRNPGKVYRKSMIIEYGDRPTKPPPPPPSAYLKPKVVVVSRPSTAPPPPPGKPKDTVVRLPIAQSPTNVNSPLVTISSPIMMSSPIIKPALIPKYPPNTVSSPIMKPALIPKCPSTTVSSPILNRVIPLPKNSSPPKENPYDKVPFN
ncbi:hypothetical protein FO519_009638 [Halicephalobus sp. NKZ332]|nr:hypothetical protein FO519_009638 [Halicephalobus sp. NKZ332]